MKLQTVNILELEGGNFVALRSFTDDVEGNKEAETYFLQVVTNLNNGIPATDEDNNVLVEDGIYENGDYQVLLTHSIHLEVADLQETFK
jgi:hypothetical protein